MAERRQQWIARVTSCKAAALGLFAPPASAAINCNYSITAVNFGNVNLSANTTFDTTGTFTATCTSDKNNSTLRVCPNINAGSGGTAGSGAPRYMLNGATQLQYNLYTDAARTQVWGSYTWGFSGTYPGPTVDIPTDGSGNGVATRTLYGRVFASQQSLPPSATAYTSSFSGAETRIFQRDKTDRTCAVMSSGGGADSANFTVQATYPASCTTSATALNFGSKSFITAAVDSTSMISVTCSNGTPYTVALNGGTAGATNPTQRKMSKAAEQITYGIYSDNMHAQPWGSTTGTNTAAGTGSGVAQSFTAYGRVPAQATPSPGIYTDTIVVTVTY